MEFLTRIFFFSKFMKQHIGKRENWLGGGGAGMVPESGRVSELTRWSGDISDHSIFQVYLAVSSGCVIGLGSVCSSSLRGMLCTYLKISLYRLICERDFPWVEFQVGS